ncbi:hypothetical protein QAD02_023557 [Eretmocerus hayati]|uniref:Uncharacterized protein n=1 Tax=Eretmocerus hayati TaxID=131215 RepID=A0ACC2PXS6_9HYME|nr:hypothetical protein QAD02_023557 [Eretmocerus hayati]
MISRRDRKIGVYGAWMFVIGVLMQIYFIPNITKEAVQSHIALQRGSLMRDLWGKFPFSFELNFYMFNVTNPKAVTDGEKPVLQEIGPFVYEEWQEKTNQLDHEDDDTVSYTTRSVFHFNADRSGSLTGHEEIIIPHVFLITLLTAVQRTRPGAMGLAAKAVDTFVKGADTIFIKVKVKDLLFDGLIVDCNIDYVRDFAAGAVCNELKAHYKEFKMRLAGNNLYLYSLWGWRNNTDSDKRVRVKRGMKDIFDVGKVVQVAGKPNISLWGNEYCDAFNGTDGTVFHPYFNRKGKEDILIYHPEFCRTLRCYYVSKSKIDGMKLLRYTLDFGLDVESDPTQKCFCYAPDKCPKKGAYDLFKCIGIPAVVTNPHFYNADPDYLNMVHGLSPNEDKHMFVMDFEPFVGCPLQVRERLQFNIFIERNEKVKLMEKLPNALLPILWIDQVVILPGYFVDEIRMALDAKKFARFSSYLLLYCGLTMCVYAGFKLFKAIEDQNRNVRPLKSERPGSAKPPANNTDQHPPASDAENPAPNNNEDEVISVVHEIPRMVDAENQTPADISREIRTMENRVRFNHLPGQVGSDGEVVSTETEKRAFATTVKKKMPVINMVTTTITTTTHDSDADSFRPASVPPGMA